VEPTVAGSLRGRVTDPQGAPLANLQVLLYDYRFPSPSVQTTTDAAGNYALRALGPGTYLVEVRDPNGAYGSGFYGAAGTQARRADATPVVIMGQDQSGIDLQLVAAGRLNVAVSGTISGTISGYTLTQVTAILFQDLGDGSWAHQQMQTQPALPTGFTFAGLAANRYRLCVAAYGKFDPGSEPVIQLAECYADQLPDNSTLFATTGLLAASAGAGPVLAYPPGEDLLIEVGTPSTVTLVLGDISQLQGRLLDPQGNPFAGATVEVAQENFAFLRRVQTNSAGEFRLGYLPSATYQLRYLDPTFQTIGGYYPGVIKPAEAEWLTLDAQSRLTDVELRLRPAATITGKLTVAGNEPPNAFLLFANRYVEGVNEDAVAIYSQAPPEMRQGLVYNPATGVYTLPGLLPGEYTLQVTAYLPNSSPVFGEYIGASNSRLTVAEGATVDKVNVTLGAGQLEESLGGVVTAAGKPIANITVGLYAQYGIPSLLPQLPFVTTTTDAQGRYTFRNLPQGGYQLLFKDPAALYATHFYTDAIVLQYAHPVQLELGTVLTDVNTTLQPAGTLAGRVHLRNGTALPNYRMLVYRQFRSHWMLLVHLDVRTDAEGRYTIPGLLPGAYRVGALPPNMEASFNGWVCSEPWSVEESCHNVNSQSPAASIPFFFPLGQGIRTAGNIGVVAGQTAANKNFIVDPLPLYLPLVSLERESAPNANLMDALAADGRFTTLLRTLTAANLSELLSRTGPFTLLAPTDAAFAGLPAGALDQLLQNPTGQLQQILLFHVLNSRIPVASIQNGMQAPTLQGKPVTFEVTGAAIRVNGVNFLPGEILATNGVIHAIDAVILPPPN
jgi:uncharacterized surface protein with fasciclin (FAS1) repeats/protocatechuate 3,4-dioxygenase beta subunit